MKEENTLIAGILDDADNKARDIIAKALSEAENIKNDGLEEARKAVDAEDRIFRMRMHQLELKEESAKRSIDRLTELKNMDSSFTKVMEMVDQKIEDLVETGSLRKALIEWTVEAAIGLDKSKAMVSSSSKAFMDEDMLREAETLIKERTGAEIKLLLDQKRCNEIGVVVSSEDGKVSYDNLISVRKRRYMKEIRKIVQEENARKNSR